MFLLGRIPACVMTSFLQVLGPLVASTCTASTVVLLMFLYCNFLETQNNIGILFRPAMFLEVSDEFWREHKLFRGMREVVYYFREILERMRKVRMFPTK